MLDLVSLVLFGAPEKGPEMVLYSAVPDMIEK